MKLDTHVHTWHSGNTTIRPLRRVMRESYNTPERVYAVAKARGMDLVAITDHDEISGALSLADRPDVVVGCEVTGGVSRRRRPRPSERLRTHRRHAPRDPAPASRRPHAAAVPVERRACSSRSTTSPAASTGRSPPPTSPRCCPGSMASRCATARAWRRRTAPRSAWPPPPARPPSAAATRTPNAASAAPGPKCPAPRPPRSSSPGCARGAGVVGGRHGHQWTMSSDIVRFATNLCVEQSREAARAPWSWRVPAVLVGGDGRAAAGGGRARRRVPALRARAALQPRPAVRPAWPVRPKRCAGCRSWRRDAGHPGRHLHGQRLREGQRRDHGARRPCWPARRPMSGCGSTPHRGWAATRRDYLALPSWGIGVPFYRDMLMYWPPYRALLRRLAADRINVVHLTTPGPIGLAAVAAARRLALPLVGSFHTDLARYTAVLSGSRALERVHAALHALALRTLPAGAGAVGGDPRAGGRRRRAASRTRPLGTRRRHASSSRRRGVRSALRAEWRVGDDRPVLLYVGRLSREKGVERLPALHDR